MFIQPEWQTGRKGMCTNSNMHTTYRFGTIHPLIKDGGELPSRLQEVVDLLRDAFAITDFTTTDTHIIARLQGAGRTMNLHSDEDSRNYWVNIVLRWATDGSGGSVDFVHDSDPNIVYRMHMSKPSMYLMDPVGGGLVASDPSLGPARWAHGVKTDDLQRDNDCLCSFIIEFRRYEGERCGVESLAWGDVTSCTFTTSTCHLSPLPPFTSHLSQRLATNNRLYLAQT